jgi:lipoprotein signal peptidase
VEGGGTTEIGYPAFNLADSAICVGVLLLFIMSFQKEQPEGAKEPVKGNGVNSGQPTARG